MDSIMKTDELVTMLANGLGAVDLRVPARRHFVAVACGTLAAILLMVALFGVRATLLRDAVLPMFWIKAAFCAALAWAGLLAVARLGRPGTPLGYAPAGVAAPLLLMWMLAAGALLGTNPEGRSELIFGQTSAVCPLIIALLSAPTFVGLLWAMQRSAATRPWLAGAAAGLASGAIGALVYTLHCPELAAPFLGIWYVLGMLIPTVVGGFRGPRLLQW
jgi:hypothetical protein